MLEMSYPTQSGYQKREPFSFFNQIKFIFIVLRGVGVVERRNVPSEV